LLQAGADVDTGYDSTLLWSVKNGYLEPVRTLLSAGADPQDTDTEGRTALAWATELGHGEIEHALREAGEEGR